VSYIKYLKNGANVAFFLLLFTDLQPGGTVTSFDTLSAAQIAGAIFYQTKNNR